MWGLRSFIRDYISYYVDYVKLNVRLRGFRIDRKVEIYNFVFSFCFTLQFFPQYLILRNLCTYILAKSWMHSLSLNWLGCVTADAAWLALWISVWMNSDSCHCLRHTGVGWHSGGGSPHCLLQWGRSVSATYIPLCKFHYLHLYSCVDLIIWILDLLHLYRYWLHTLWYYLCGEASSEWICHS